MLVPQGQIRFRIRLLKFVLISGTVALLIGTTAAVTARDRHQPDAPAEKPGKYDHLRAHGKALAVLRAARSQIGVPYVYGAQPRSPNGLLAVGHHKHRDGFDCSSFVAYAFQVGAGEWISGTIAHTDQIWTQGGLLPLTPTAGETDKIIRGTGRKPPPGGYRPGDILEMREGAGGYWGHVLIVSERGQVIQSYPPDVYETEPIETYLRRNSRMGWVRVKALQDSSN
ncbi:MAG: C40 family peptidase [Actinobacteria bacterium]|nr:C40 family peptidase [Actinomycetota bacterium]